MNNKPKILLVLFFIFLNGLLNCQEKKVYEFENKKYYSGLLITCSFENGIFTYSNLIFNEENRIDDDFPQKTDSGSYTISEENGFCVANVNFSDGERKIYIFYESYHLILYDTFLKTTLYFVSTPSDDDWLYPINYASSSSFLTETISNKQIEYNPINLINKDITKVWVEGAIGYGIGETIRVGKYNGIKHLLIINGFFSPNKSSLYLDNSRIKKVLVKGYDNEGRVIYEGEETLKDSPNLQLISSVVECSEFDLIILEVYKGRKYEDTAISGIFNDGIRAYYEMIEKYF